MLVVKRGETFHNPSKHELFDWLSEDLITCVLKGLTMKERIYGAASCCKQFRSISHSMLQEDLKLSSEQVGCFLDAMRGENIFITGAAGCGKSHVLKAIIKYKGRKNVAVTASTGCAAAIIGAATFHSTCSLGLGKAPAKIIAKRILDGDKRTYSRLMEMKTLIVDEAGMLTGKLFDKAGEVIGMIRRVYGRGYDAVIANAQSTFPFDDVQLILCGDALQLPPVDADSEGWIFESKSWKKMQFKVHLLEQVHRQQDVKFIEILKRMRIGKSTISDLSYLVQNSRKERHEGALKLYAVNAPADNENELKLAELPGVAHRFCAIDSAQNANVHQDILQERLKHCQAPRLLILKVGARVMCLKNVDHRLVNGSLGTVKRVVPVRDSNNNIECARVEVEFDGQLGASSFLHVFETHICGSEVAHENLFTVRGQDHQKLAQRIQIPLRLAWAVSMHKSQGTVAMFEL